MSDLHLEFASLEIPLPEGDVLVLAGDITVAHYLADNKNDSRSRSFKKSFNRLLDEANSKFRQVFYLTGNHEYYGSSFDQAHENLENIIKNRAVFFNNTTQVIDNVVFVGGTLWTDMNRRNPTDMYQVQYGMNDFRLIQEFSAEKAANLHDDTLAYFSKMIALHPEKKVVVLTHHAPHSLGLNASHTTTSRINHGYYSDLTDWILDRPNIKYWVHGHTHIITEYDIGQTKVVSNARGYVGYEYASKYFKPDKFFEI